MTNNNGGKEMKKLTATVRDEDGTLDVITRDNYESKSAFRETLHRNGYTVIGRIFAEGDDETTEGHLYWGKGVK